MKEVATITMKRKSLLYGAALLALTGLLASCSTVPGSSPQSSGEYVLTVQTTADDTQAGVLQQYGGQIISWHPEEGFAILKLSAQEKAKLSGEISIQAVENSSLFSPEASAAGAGAWGTGINVWGTGLGVWAGGWTSWAGGTSTIPTLPAENRFAWNLIKLPQGQAVGKNFGTGVKVAVIDTGIDTAHPMFSGRLAPSTEWKDFVDGDSNPAEVSGGTSYGHGTAVAGIILQVAPKATILPIRVLDQNGMGDVAKVVSAIDWAIQQGAKVINLSLGTDMDVPALKTQIEYATGKGIYVVASAGNEASTTAMTYPAQYATSAKNHEYLISVGSTTLSALLSQFCNTSAALELVAPGEGIYTSYPDNRVAVVLGTSFAAPQVAGAAAFLYGDTASANRANLQNYLLSGAISTSQGHKMLSVLDGLRKLPDFTKKQALMVVWDSEEPDSSDRVLKTRLENLGYQVTLKADFAASASDATGKAIVLISETVDDILVGSKFRSVAVPVMVWENGIYDDMKMTGTGSGTAFADASGQTQVAMTGSTHPLAAGLLGNQTVYSASAWMAWGAPGSSASKVASIVGNSSRSTIFGYDKGATMVGLTAPARRTGFFWSDFSANYLGGKGGWLFDAAVTWTATGN